MVLPWHLRRNGCGVRDARSAWLVTDADARVDFVVAKVTPTMEANLGYKLFMLFATINIGGMAIFSVYVCVCCGMAQPLTRPRHVVASYPRPRGSVWKKWTSYSVR